MEIFHCPLYMVSIKRCCKTVLPEAPLILYYTVKIVRVEVGTIALEALIATKFVQSLVTKRNLVYTLDVPDYKAHVPFLRKLKCALWSEKYGILIFEHFVHEFSSS